MKEKFRVNEHGELMPELDERGYEIPSSVPIAPPVGFVRREPLHERIRAMVQHEYQRAREMSEVETPEEADDFRIPGDDVDDPREGRFAMLPGYEWEENYEPPETFAEMRQRLVDAGWTPPAKPARTPPEGGAPATGAAGTTDAPVSSAAPSDVSVPRPDSQGSPKR